MPQETRINHEHFTEFLPLLADDLLDELAACMGKAWKKMVKGEPIHKFTPSELADLGEATNHIVMALQTGLLLVKHQKELADVALSIFESRGVSVDEMWQNVMEVYHQFLRVACEEHSERDRISPNHFRKFLLYFADGQLKEMSKYMDNEWKKGWGKRENPFRLKPGEKAKLVTVGNSATVPIIVGLLIAKRQPELLGVDWSIGVSVDVLWERILRTYRSLLYYKHFVEGKPS